MMPDPLLAAAGLVKGYLSPAGYLPVLASLDFEVAPGEMVAIVGASGVGKSTLLHVLGTLDRPEKGTVRVAGAEVFGLAETALREFRNRTIGFVFQFHHLLPEFTAVENVMMPLLIARQPEGEARRAASELLALVGLQDRGEHRPSALSGESSSGWRWPEPWSARPGFSWPTNPRGTSTGRRGTDCTSSSGVSTARRASP